jgi:pyrimidine-nucleoside phosphorylase
MLFVELIRRKRDGQELTREEIEAIVAGYTRGDFPDYQVSAFLMASLIRGLSKAETAALTEAMLSSGQTLDFSDLPAVKVDKHSTGGVGDKTSLLLSPIVAAAGLYVPMISGRGLGHTGGTLDKLEAIPGFSVNVSLGEFRNILRNVGCAMIGQTAEIAPADKKLYALRDVTGTVESPYLICASIMSKKLAEGIDALVLDVKTGSGAFMKDPRDAEFLAELMVETGQRMGKKVVALLTDMDQPLGRYIGNALEVEECIQILRGEVIGNQDLVELTHELAAWMFYLGGRCASVAEGCQLSVELLANGKAMAKFRELIRAQGGNPAVCDDTSLLPKAKFAVDILAGRKGFVHSIDCEQMGYASLVLGGGRLRKEDAVDPAVGIVLHKKVGDAVRAGDPICTVHYNDEKKFNEARNMIMLKAYEIKDEAAPHSRRLVQKTIGGDVVLAELQKSKNA